MPVEINDLVIQAKLADEKDKNEDNNKNKKPDKEDECNVDSSEVKSEISNAFEDHDYNKWIR